MTAIASSHVTVRAAAPDDRVDMARIEAVARSQLVAVGIDLADLDVGGLPEDVGWDLAMVAVTDDGLIGLVRATADQDQIIVDQVSVDPVWGRQGIGTRLLEELATASYLRGFQRMVGTTFATVAFNAPFYQRLGACIVPDAVLHQRREVERGIGLDRLGKRAVVSFDLSHLNEAIGHERALPSGLT